MSNKFRNANNVRLLEALFFERAVRPNVSRKYVLYTLKDADHNGYPSLYLRYLEMEDPTEYQFAERYFENYEHWRQISETSWFKPHITRWRNELELKIRAKALEGIQQIANNKEDRNSYNANKFLLARGWKDGKESKVGRPTKEAIKKEAEILHQESNSIEEDFNRLMN